MKRLLLVLLGLVVLVIAAAVIVPFLIPTETYTRQIAQQVEAATGREFSIDGPVSFSLLPALALEANDVRLANAEGAAEPEMVSLKQLDVELKVWPLLQGSVELDRFVLVEPVIHLEVDEEGRANWEFAGTDATAPADDAPPAGEGGGDGGLPLSDLKLGEIRLENALVTFRDAQAGTNERIEDVSMTVSLEDLQSPFSADGSLVYKGETIELDLDVETPIALAEGGNSALAVQVGASPVVLTFAGEILGGEAPGAKGNVDLDVKAIRDLAAWLAEPLDLPGDAVRTLQISGALEASPERVAFSTAEIGFDDIEATGDFAAEIGGPVPRLSGRLDVGALDVNPYLPPEAQAEGVPQGGGTESSAPAGPTDWSDEPIEIPALDFAEVDFELTVASMRVQKLELGKTVLHLGLEGGTLTADLREFALYNGSGAGTFTLATAGDVPRIEQNFKLEGLQALPFLTAAADLDMVEGTASTEFQLQTQGRTQREFIANSNGRGNAFFRDGALVGFNLAAMVRNVGTAFLSGTARETQKTDFAELGGTFQIQNGVLTNNDLRLQAPVLRVEGAGDVNLNQRTVDYLITPKAAPTLQGQGGRQNVAGIMVPVRVRGSWEEPKFEPDLEGAIGSLNESGEAIKQQVEELQQQPEQIRERAQSIEEKAKSGDLGGALEDLNEAEGLLRGVLGR